MLRVLEEDVSYAIKIILAVRDLLLRDKLPKNKDKLYDVKINAWPIY